MLLIVGYKRNLKDEKWVLTIFGDAPKYWMDGIKKD